MEFDDLQMQELHDELVDIIISLGDEDLITVYNHVRQDKIYPMSLLDEFVTDMEYTATELIDMLSAEFNTNNDWFTIDSHGFLVSFDYLDEVVDVNNDADEIASELIRDGRTCNIPAIVDLFVRFKRY